MPCAVGGNNTPIFFIRDTMRFPHFIRTQKRQPDSGLQDWNMRWDFWTLQPESAHQVTYMMGDRGIPKSWRHMNGVEPHGPAPASDDPDTPVNKDEKVLTQKATHAG